MIIFAKEIERAKINLLKHINIINISYCFPKALY